MNNITKDVKLRKSVEQEDGSSKVEAVVVGQAVCPRYDDLEEIADNETEQNILARFHEGNDIHLMGIVRDKARGSKTAERRNRFEELKQQLANGDITEAAFIAEVGGCIA